jgi:23S rRNA (adenine-N6)-dimethyltransferase
MSRHNSRSEVGRALSHHSLRSSAVAERILAHSGLAPPDTVYEIGPGAGLLTAALACRARSVVAVEHDREAWSALRRRFGPESNVRPILGDFIRYPLPRTGTYHVIGNIPFARTSAIMRKLLEEPNPPQEALLVMQREAALRWSGAVRESAVSVIAKTRFDFTVAMAMRRRDFDPPPRVDCAVLKFVARPEPVLARGDIAAFQSFVLRGFGEGRRTLRRNLGPVVDHAAFEAIASRHHLPMDAAPGDLPFGGWRDLFAASIAARRRAGEGARRYSALTSRLTPGDPYAKSPQSDRPHR